MERFKNRTHAGQLLAEKLSSYSKRSDVIILALPRGGMPVGFEIAKTLHVSIDVFLVRKLGVPGESELAMGAIALGGIRVLNQEVVNSLRITLQEIEAVEAREKDELVRRNQLYRQGRLAPNVKGKTVILVDDGIATGATMMAAIAAIKKLEPTKIVVAVPVADSVVYEEFSQLVEEIICLQTPSPLFSIGMCYWDFAQTTDEEVSELLEEARKVLK